MTVTVEIPEEIEARLLAQAQACGVPLPEFVRDFLIDHYEDGRSPGCRNASGRAAGSDKRKSTAEKPWPGRLNMILASSRPRQ